MNAWGHPDHQTEMIKATYPPGTRIMLMHMGTDPRPIEDNTRGTVYNVDGLGTIHCKFDNGWVLGIIPGEDSFRKLTKEELAEEQGIKAAFQNIVSDAQARKQHTPVSFTLSKEETTR